MKEAQRDAEIFNNQEWEMYLQKTLVGKKITAKMTSMPTMNTKTKEMHGKRETKNFTITVADVVTSDLSELLLNIVVADENDKMYGLSLNDKIYFE